MKSKWASGSSGEQLRLKSRKIRSTQGIKFSFFSIDEVGVKSFPISIGVEIECGDDQRALLMLRVGLVPGVDGDRDLMGVCVSLGDD